MKKAALLLGLLCSFNSFSQDPLLFETDWFLAQLTIDGTAIDIPNNTEVGIIPTYFMDFEPLDYFESTVCNTFAADVTIGSDQITFNNIVVGLFECTIAANTAFESVYFPFFQDHEGVPNDYSIFGLLGPETGDQLVLIIANPDGDKAEYWNKILSIPENSINELTVFPNPTQDVLSWDASFKGPVDVRIFSLQGVLIKEGIENQNSVNVSALSAGIYFIELQEGNTKSRAKFIKQ
jgi:hypothetical protein